MNLTIALIVFAICIIVAFFVEPAAVLLCILAAWLLVTYIAADVPWVALAAATWLLIQVIAGIKAAVAASKVKSPPAA